MLNLFAFLWGPSVRYGSHGNSTVGPIMCRFFTVATILALSVCTPSTAADAHAAWQESLANYEKYCADAVKAGDYKSLARGVGGLRIMAVVLERQGDDQAWQAAVSPLAQAVRDLEAAARTSNANAAQEAVTKLHACLGALARVKPTGAVTPLGKSPTGMRNLMYLLEAVQADGKTALIVGDIESTRKAARVLADLGPLVLNEKSDARWGQMSKDLVAAADAVANSADNNAAAVRTLYKKINQTCEACHNRDK